MAFLYLLPSSWYLQPGFLWGLPAPNAQPSGAVDSGASPSPDPDWPLAPVPLAKG